MKTILCYGDSNTYGYNPNNGMRYPKNVRWPGVLQQILGDDYDVVEEGCNGRTTINDDPTEGWINGLDYLRPCLKTHKPVDIVILMLGTNDLKNYFGLSAAEIANGAGVLVEAIRDYAPTQQQFMPEIILVSPPLVGDDIEHSVFNSSFDMSALERSKQFADEYRRVAEETGCTFFDAASCAATSPLDSLHLTPESHCSLATELSKLILK